MNITLIILLLVVVSLILGPILMLKPKPEQRRREQLRLKARQLGLHFALRTPPKRPTDIEASRPTPCYFLPPAGRKDLPPEWTLQRTAYSHEANFFQDWDWQGEGRASPQAAEALRQALPQLPADVTAVASGSAGISVFWGEQGGEAVLDQLAELLGRLGKLE